MKVLLVSNQKLNAKGVGNPIIYKMTDSLSRAEGIEKATFAPFYKTFGFIRSLRKQATRYDIIHIHFGGMCALLTWIYLLGIRRPKLVTFHGTDIHAKSIRTARSYLKKAKIKLNQWASFICIALYNKSGFVAKEMIPYVPGWMRKRYADRFFVQRLGVDYESMQPEDSTKAIQALGLPFKKYALFSDWMNAHIKRRDIARAIINELNGDYTLLIMSGVPPTDVPHYISAASFLLLTSDEEGSPNIIRECLAMNKPVFSVDVGDAKEQLAGLANSCIISRNAKEAAQTIREHLAQPYTDNTRESRKAIICFDDLNQKMVSIYQEMLRK